LPDDRCLPVRKRLGWPCLRPAWIDSAYVSSYSNAKENQRGRGSALLYVVLAGRATEGGRNQVSPWRWGGSSSMFIGTASLGYRTFPCSQCRRKFNERARTLYNHLQYPTDIVLLVVLWRLRYKRSLRDLAKMFLEKWFEFTHEAVRDWEARFAPLITATTCQATGQSWEVMVLRKWGSSTREPGDWGGLRLRASSQNFHAIMCSGELFRVAHYACLDQI
jgi:hypothetical protein